VSPDARYDAVMSSQLRAVAPLQLGELFAAVKRHYGPRSSSQRSGVV